LYHERSNNTISPPAGRQVGDVALEIPLRLFPIARLLQRHHPRAARIEMLHEPLNGPALAGGVAALEHDHVPAAGALGVVLQLQQLDLQPALQPLVFVARHAVVIRVALAPGVDAVAVLVEQDGVVVVFVVDGVAVFAGRKGVQIYLCHSPSYSH
jgi:hypothetical protein